MNFQVGQIVFIVLKKKQQVLPARVIEEVIKKTLAGEEISYSVEVPIKDRLQVVSLSDLDCDVFRDLPAVRTYLLSNAETVIDRLLTRAEKISAHRFEPVSFDSPSEQNRVKVELEGGVVANVSLPESV